MIGGVSCKNLGDSNLDGFVDGQFSQECKTDNSSASCAMSQKLTDA